MQLSLFSKLKELEKIGTIELRKTESSHILKEDGRWHFQGHPIEVIADFVGPAPDGSDHKFKDPHDVAWCPETKTLLAWAEVHKEPFKLMPKTLREKFHKSKTRLGGI